MVVVGVAVAESVVGVAVAGGVAVAESVVVTGGVVVAAEHDTSTSATVAGGVVGVAVAGGVAVEGGVVAAVTTDNRGGGVSNTLYIQCI